LSINTLLVVLAIIISSCNSTDETKSTNNKSSDVIVVGAMKDVMWKGELAGSIKLDTIANKDGLYGLGPVDYLQGELLIFDGRAFKGTVLTDSTMLVEESYNAEAPFFVYANETKWDEEVLPDSIVSINQLDDYLDYKSANSPDPFVYKLIGQVDTAKIHLQNLAPGSIVSSPDEAHQGQTNYELFITEVEIVGFFSKQHTGIFTHHKSNVHMHLITKDKSKMGHLDEARFSKGKIMLYLPRIN